MINDVDYALEEIKYRKRLNITYKQKISAIFFTKLLILNLKYKT